MAMDMRNLIDSSSSFDWTYRTKVFLAWIGSPNDHIVKCHNKRRLSTTSYLLDSPQNDELKLPLHTFQSFLISVSKTNLEHVSVIVLQAPSYLQYLLLHLHQIGPAPRDSP